jgi:D-alanine-D-alanine ligase
MHRTSILLLFGGESSEHDVSISSARNIYAALDNTKFDVILGYIDRSGKWWLLDRFSNDINTHGAPQLAPVLGSGSFVSFPSSKIVKPDVIFPVLHGKNGEDGSVQAIAELLHVPIVGCDMTASAVCMDKLITKEILEFHGIPVVPYIVHRQGAPAPDFSHLSMQLGIPVFVKPARSGSSVGVSKVYNEEGLERALEDAHKHDAVALIERGIAGRELEIAVLGNPPDHTLSSVGEVIVNDDFYSFETKYGSQSKTQLAIPANVEKQTETRITTLAKEAYETLGCKGLARVDFFLADDGTLYLNELNTFPGFTNISMYPKLWKHAGVSYSQLVEQLIDVARRDAKRSSVSSLEQTV